MPKKFGDWMITHAVSSFSFASRSSRSQLPDAVVVAELLDRHALMLAQYVRSTSRYSGCTVRATSTRCRPVTRTAIIAASGTAVDPSYIDAFATSMPVNWQIIV